MISFSLAFFFSLSLSLIHLFLSTLSLLCKLCVYMVGQGLTYPFPFQVWNLCVKPGDFFVDSPTFVVPFNHKHLRNLDAPFPLTAGHYNFPRLSTVKGTKNYPTSKQRCKDRINLMKLKSKLLKTSRKSRKRCHPKL